MTKINKGYTVKKVTVVPRQVLFKNCDCCDEKATVEIKIAKQINGNRTATKADYKHIYLCEEHAREMISYLKLLIGK